jgi:Phosphotransferase enzyme family
VVEDYDIAEAKVIIGRIVPPIQRFISESKGDSAAREVSLKLLKLDSRRICFSLSSKSVNLFVKKFRENDVSSYQSYKKEVQILRWLNTTNLAPKLVCVNDHERVIVTDLIKGVSLKKLIERKNSNQLIATVADWVAAFTRKMPKTPERTGMTWASYIEKYKEISESEIFLSERKSLEQFTIDQWTVSHNDFDLSNFILDDALVGVDFEQAARKPLGWDAILACRAFARVYPEKLNETCDLIASRFCANIHEIDTAEMSRLAKVIVSASIFGQRRSTNRNFRSNVQQAQEYYISELGLSEPPHIVYAPCSELKDIRDDGIDEVQRFSDGLVYNIVAAASTISKPRDQKPEELLVPSGSLSAFCGVCRGKCCEDGLSAGAFLDVAALAEIYKREEFSSPDAMHGEYLSRLPKRSIKGSCLYHTPEGCALPRNLRSRTCNEFICGKAKYFLDAIRVFQPRQTIISTDQEAIKQRRFSVYTIDQHNEKEA